MNAFNRKANYHIEVSDPEKIIIRDIGPWDQHPTVTNDVESVVADLAPKLMGRKLFYWDSLGSLDEIVIENGKFEEFKAGYNL